KEDGSRIKKGEETSFKVIEFNKEFRRVVVSHTSTFREEDIKIEKSNNNNNNNNNSNNTIETSTLGDIDSLAELKKKMEEGGN
ncbi:MAG: 30S ribosomal protein S1, partial [Algoriella sp.]